MLKFPEPKDPDETKDYVFDWSGHLSDGETISSQVVSFVDAAGTTSPGNTHDDMASRVWLQGGTHGGTVIFTIRVVLNHHQKTLEQAFSVAVVDSVIGQTQSELDYLKEHRKALLEAKMEAVGGTTVMVRNGRFGNEMRMQSMTYDQICLALERNRQEIATEERIAAGGSRRGVISMPVWTN